jgi:hypothetical protein
MSCKLDDVQCDARNCFGRQLFNLAPQPKWKCAAGGEDVYLADFPEREFPFKDSLFPISFFV